jgi:putative glutamine amidotransferase
VGVLIGITTSFASGEQRLSHAYVQAVERAGGIPLILPMLDSDASLHAIVRLVDGLLIPGGPAVGEGLVTPLPDDLPPTPLQRSESDRRTIAAFLAARKPILGVCYGMQLLNALGGGLIYGDVQRDLDGSSAHSEKRGAGEHRIRVEPDTHLVRILRCADSIVNTHHIQAIARVGAGYRIAATAPDGVIEAIENEEGTVLGVQYHPERMGDEGLPLFRHLVECARQDVVRRADVVPCVG